MPAFASNILMAVIVLGLAAYGLITLADAGIGSARGWIFVLAAAAIAELVFHLW